MISRQAAIDAIDEVLIEDEQYKIWFKLALQNLPSAQQGREKGKWIPVDSFSAFGGDKLTWEAHGNPVAYHYCSNCREQSYAGEDGQSLITKFCPNCGADMRGE